MGDKAMTPTELAMWERLKAERLIGAGIAVADESKTLHMTIDSMTARQWARFMSGRPMLRLVRGDK